MEKLLNKFNTSVLKKLDRYIWLWILILSIPAIWALLVPGFYGASDDLHIAWLYEFHKTLFMGQIPPRFVPDLSFGFGYPLFNFAFPLPFYTSEIFHLLGLSLVDCIKALFLLSVPFSAIFMYLLLRQFVSKALSFAGAILYIYTPYRSTDIYVRGDIGEILSFVILPLLTLSVVKLTEEGKKIKYFWIGAGSLSLAALVLTHNITAYMFIPFIVLLWLLRIIFLSQNKKEVLTQSAVTALLGLSVSCFFWIPAFLDSHLMKYDTVFNFVDHFPTLLQLIKPYWGYGASVPGPYDGMSFFIGEVNIGLIIIAMVSLIFFFKKYSKEQKIILVWALICLISSIFLMNFRSSFIWNILPLLPYFQFPWRFLIIVTFVAPIFVISLLPYKNKWLISLIMILLMLVTVGSFFRPQDFLGRLDSYYLNRYIPTPMASKEYLNIAEEYLRLPKNAQSRPDKNYPLLFSDSGTINDINKINDLHVKANVASKEGIMLNLNKYFFPGWMAEVDGKKAQIESGAPFGQVSLELPPGEHQVEIMFTETNLKKTLDAISLVSFLVSLWLTKNLWCILRKIGHSY